MTGLHRHAIVASVVFDGVSRHEDCAVVIEGQRIAGLVARRDLRDELPARVLPEGAWLAPGFIDIQVNGGGDVLLNDDPSPASMASIARAHRKFGTTSLLPTLITDSREKMRAALAAADEAAASNPSILGVHLEGPFLSPEKRGVHRRDLIRAPDREDLELLTAPRAGVTLVTLAPERAPPGFIAKLVQAGVRVSLGHSIATYEQTKAAMAEGLTGFTHVLNAMPPLLSRNPGPMPAALESPRAYFGMIVDGEHVHPAMLRLALRGAAHPMLVTDAMPPVGGTKTTFTLFGQKIAAHDGACLTEDATLAGSNLSMAMAVRNCVTMLDVRLTWALRFASAAPAAFLGLNTKLGRIAEGFRADLVAFAPPGMRIYDTWVAGEPSEHAES
jgi:N-acetylglucosamine-6-phosphate deacetylase